jgi:16S rRNA (adenine1518-N6/adenine1519-N6)-dimethyltransferase
LPIYKPSELIAFLEKIGASPKKSLSQNFLIDGNIVRKIVAYAGIKPGENVLEIGPGPGVLTEELLAQESSVFAIEKDRKFAQALHRLQTPDHRLHIFEGDALKTPIDILPPHTKVVANLPYQITTPLLTRLLPCHEIFSSMTVMVQKEYATRLLADAGSENYSSLSIFVQFYSHPSYGFTVEKSCFYPPPQIQSSVVQFILKKPPKLSSEKAFFDLTRRAFQQRRKMVRSSLKTYYSLTSIERGLEKAGKHPQARPEELSLTDFLILFQEIQQK